MPVRLSLMIAALALVVSGCHQHARKARTHQVIHPPLVKLAKHPAPQTVQLRGAYNHGGPKAVAPRTAAPRVVAPRVAARRVVAPRTVAPPPHPRVMRMPPRYPIVQAAAHSAPYHLDSGDRLRIVVFAEENLTRSYSIDGGGFISMPLIGAVRARGATTFELERRIAGRLRRKYVKDPKVTVEVQDYRPFFILGEVRRPGQFPYVSGMTVRTAVAIAGGYTERARERKVKLTRRVNGRETTFKVRDSYTVLPGDTIYVTERFF